MSFGPEAVNNLSPSCEQSELGCSVTYVQKMPTVCQEGVNNEGRAHVSSPGDVKNLKFVNNLSRKKKRRKRWLIYLSLCYHSFQSDPVSSNHGAIYVVHEGGQANRQ